MPGQKATDYRTNVILRRQESGDTQDMLECQTETGFLMLALQYDGTIRITSSGSAPATKSGAGQIFVQNGALKYISPNGVVTQIAPA